MRKSEAPVRLADISETEKTVDGRYSRTLDVTSFKGVVPADEPRFLLLTMLDEPKGLPETHGFRTSGWNAAPLGGAVFGRVLPMLGQLPKAERRTDLPGE